MAELLEPNPEAPLVLASGSPRRRVLLAMLGVEIDIVPADLDEDVLAAGIEPIEAVQQVARAKVQAVDGLGRPVLGADTGVVLDGALLGKPRNRAHGAELLAALSGRKVQVVSCVAVKDSAGEVDDRLAISTLSIDTLDDGTIATYLATGEADDKAGALAVQGAAKAFTTLVDGSRSNVVGLPLAETIELLANVGIELREPR